MLLSSHLGSQQDAHFPFLLLILSADLFCASAEAVAFGPESSAVFAAQQASSAPQIDLGWAAAPGLHYLLHAALFLTLNSAQLSFCWGIPGTAAFQMTGLSPRCPFSVLESLTFSLID